MSGDTDDAPLWAEVADVVFGPALAARTMIHMLFADCLDDVEKDWPDDDLTVRSPVPELRGHMAGAMARGTCSIMAGAVAFVLAPTTPAAAASPQALLVSVWVWMQLAVLWADPLALAVLQLRGDGIVFDRQTT